MKYVKTLGLAAVAAAALTALVGAGTASGTVLCSVSPNASGECPAANKLPVGTVLGFSLRKGTSWKLVDTSGTTIDTCTGSTIEGSLQKAGAEKETITASVTTSAWGGCTFTTKTLTLGKLEGHVTEKGPNGTVTIDAKTEVTINTVLFGSCIYALSEGTLLGNVAGASPAGFGVSAVATRISNFVCPVTASWTAEYDQTKPEGTGLYFAVK